MYILWVNKPSSCFLRFYIQHQHQFRRKFCALGYWKVLNCQYHGPRCHTRHWFHFCCTLFFFPWVGFLWLHFAPFHCKCDDIPYEVLAGVSILDQDLWNLIRAVHNLEYKYFGMRYRDNGNEIKARKFLKRKAFRLAAQLPQIEIQKRTELAKSALDPNNPVTKEGLTALAQAKLAYALDFGNTSQFIPLQTVHSSWWFLLFILTALVIHRLYFHIPTPPDNQASSPVFCIAIGSRHR